MLKTFVELLNTLSACYALLSPLPFFLSNARLKRHCCRFAMMRHVEGEVRRLVKRDWLDSRSLQHEVHGKLYTCSMPLKAVV